MVARALEWASSATGVPVSEALGQWRRDEDVTARWRMLEIARALLGLSRAAFAVAIGRAPETIYVYRRQAEGRRPNGRPLNSIGLTPFELHILRAFRDLTESGGVVTVLRVASAAGATESLHPEHARTKTGRALAKLASMGLIAWTPKRGRPFGSQTKRAA